MRADEVEAKARALAGEPSMAKLVARATEEQVRDRIAQAALDDGCYREQLFLLAATRNRIYAQAVDELCRLDPERAQEFRSALEARRQP
jgi:hypothetical protein